MRKEEYRQNRSLMNRKGYFLTNYVSGLYNKTFFTDFGYIDIHIKREFVNRVSIEELKSFLDRLQLKMKKECDYVSGDRVDSDR